MFTVYYNLHSNNAIGNPVVHPYATCDIANSLTEANRKIAERASQGYVMVAVVDSTKRIRIR